MKHENTLLSKLNEASDWLIRVVVINLLMIATALPIVTLYASLHAGYRLMHDYANQDETPLFKGYFKYWWEGLPKKIWLGLLFIVFGGLTVLNVTYYVDIIRENPQALYVIGYYVTIAAMVGLYIILIHSFSCMLVFPNLRVTKLFKLSFYLSGKYFLRTSLLVVIHLASMLMLMTPITQFMFVFIGLSLPMLVNAIMTRPIVSYLESLGEKRG